MSQRTKKVSRAVAIVLVAVLMLVGVALLALQTQTANDYVLDETTTRVNEQLAGEFQADRLSGPLLWGATLHEVAVHDEHGELVLEAYKIDVRYSLVPLLFGDRQIDSIRLEEMDLFVEQYPDQAYNFQEVAGPEPGDRALIIDEVRVADGNIVYRGQAKGGVQRVILVENISALASVTTKPDGTYEAAVDNAEFDLIADTLPRRMPTTLSDARAERAGDRLELSAAQLVLDDAIRVDPLELTAYMGQDLEARVERVDVTARWQSEAFDWEGTRLQASRGQLEARLNAVDEAAAWHVSSNIQMAASGLLTEEIRADRLTADLSMVGMLMSPGESFDYELDATMNDAAYNEITAEEVGVDLTGALVAAAEGADETFQDGSARGAISLREVQGPRLSTPRVDIDVDLDGPTDELLGSLSAEMELLSIGEDSFTTARLDLGLEPQRRFDLHTSAIPAIGPDIRVFAQAAGQLTEKSTGAELTAFEAGRPELTWRLRQPARVVVDDDQIVINGMSLRAGPLSTNLDGTYPLSGDALSSIVDQLALTHLEDLLDLEGVRERLPERLREELPDEAEEDIREEIRRRIPLPDL